MSESSDADEAATKEFLAKQIVSTMQDRLEEISVWRLMKALTCLGFDVSIASQTASPVTAEITRFRTDDRPNLSPSNAVC
jgi:hypothetical protein